MKGMIFAAGLGTRMLPLTANLPKALINYQGKTLLEHAILKLKASGIDDIIINVHHYAGQIISFLDQHDYQIKISISDESKELLDTGGGLKKANWFFDDEPFVALNVDIISDIKLKTFISFHTEHSALATLAIRNRKSSRYLLFDNDYRLCGWENINTQKKIISRHTPELNAFAFSGIHVLDPQIFEYMPAKNNFSIIELYLNLAAQNRIYGYHDKEEFWLDCGRPENLT